VRPVAGEACVLNVFTVTPTASSVGFAAATSETLLPLAVLARVLAREETRLGRNVAEKAVAIAIAIMRA
jgi:hypothetical protein